MLFFGVGGRLKEETKPTTTEEPQEEATDCQTVQDAPEAVLDCATPIEPRTTNDKGNRFRPAWPWERLAHAV